MGNVATYRLTTIEQAVQVATTVSHSWFRGHSRVAGALTPRVFRPEVQDDVVKAFRPDLELQVIETFRREAAVAEGVPIPGEEDLLGWLYLMQHYRAPTRLLDWTHNALVALFFVVSADLTSDGEFWALFPQALNRQAHIGDGFPLPGRNKVLEFLVRQPYWAGTASALAQDLGLNVVPNRPVAFLPSRRFPRLTRQAGAFTIHPPPEPGHSVTDILSDAKHLVRYIIPASMKARLRDDLYHLGVDHYALFPELEGLTRRIEHEMRVIAYSPPDPPTADGQVDA